MPDTHGEMDAVASIDESAKIWRKSSRSMTNGNCVEVAWLPTAVVGVRDSKRPRGDMLRFTSVQWKAFLGDVRSGEFDR